MRWPPAQTWWTYRLSTKSPDSSLWVWRQLAGWDSTEGMSLAEKKIALDGVPDYTDPHDADNVYPRSGVCSASGTLCGTASDCPTGQTCDAWDGLGEPTIFQWVASLNKAKFAGHGDWRIPNVKELYSIVDHKEGFPMRLRRS